MTIAPDHHVAIIGGGFSGIGAAILLDKAGFDDYLMIEEGDGVGGAWHWNTYPGVAVDIPSFSYQFSFEQQAGWSRVYAPGEELKRYAEHCVDKYDVRRRTRLNTRVTSAVFDEDSDVWRLGTADGDTITARHVIGATGVLTQPKLPEIDGVQDFAGEVMHTARWDHDIDLTGKRVAIFGTGASAVQVIPSIAADVAHLTVFQRTPIWCLPKPDSTLPPLAQLALRVPGAKRATRLLSQTFVELTFPLAAHFHNVMPAAAVGERIGMNHLRRAVRDPEVREKLHGHVEVRQVFKVSRLGNIAGCFVTDGHVQRGSKIRLTRGGTIVTEDLSIESLKRVKDDVKEVKAGLECGIKLAGYDDIKVGDVFEAYVRETHERTL